MKIKALATFTVWTGQMQVFNRGDVGELPDDYAASYIESGYAVPADADPLDHDGDGEKGGSIAQTGEDIPALRARYKEVLGKAPFNGWDAAELTRRIDEALADDDEAPVS